MPASAHRHVQSGGGGAAGAPGDNIRTLYSTAAVVLSSHRHHPSLCSLTSLRLESHGVKMDRIGICLSADAEPLTQEDRLDAVQRALDFNNDPQVG